MKALNNKGVTIVELLIYLGLVSMMLVILSELFVSILNESVETQNYSSVQTDGRYLTAFLRYSINNADSISTPAVLGSTSGDLILVKGGIESHFYLSEGKLYLNDSTGDYLVSDLYTEITNLEFTRQGNVGGKPVISLSFTATSGASGTKQYESQNFVGAGGLR